MSVRVFKLLREANIDRPTLEDLLKALGYKEPYISSDSRVSDDIANRVLGLRYGNLSFFDLIELNAKKDHGFQPDSNFPLKIVGRIDLDAINNPSGRLKRNEVADSALPDNINGLFPQNPPQYDNKHSFWIDELFILSPAGKVNRIAVGAFDTTKIEPLYSILIGNNGVGKSSIQKEIVDFFIDLQACSNNNVSKSPVNKGGLQGVVYHIDGVRCEVVKLNNYFLAKIDGNVCALNNLRLPSIVACHFGAFDKFPTQKVNGASQTRYDVPYYKYVGAHVNGAIISSSSIVFRLLFALNENMDDRQRQNICSILDFIGYDHKISLQYSIVMKSKKADPIRDKIFDLVDKDKEHSNFTKSKKNQIATGLYNFYNNKTFSSKAQYYYRIDFDNVSGGLSDDLQNIYKLKQYGYIGSTNAIFYKQGCEIASDEMSSGEFAMLSTVLCISAAANDPHTLVLLDEPELSQHPNWQMTLIDNLDRALCGKSCHLLIATHSHMLVSDLPMDRSCVVQLEKNKEGILNANFILESTYGWSAEEVLLKVFKTATDRNRYFGERIGKLLEKIGDNSISPKEVSDELDELQEISMHLSNLDPMKRVLNTIVEAYKR